VTRETELTNRISTLQQHNTHYILQQEQHALDNASFRDAWARVQSTAQSTSVTEEIRRLSMSHLPSRDILRRQPKSIMGYEYRAFRN